MLEATLLYLVFSEALQLPQDYIRRQSMGNQMKLKSPASQYQQEKIPIQVCTTL